MSWGKLEDTFADEPKFYRLGSELGITFAQAAGHMAVLWSWAHRHAPDGDLCDYDVPDIERAAKWEGDPGVFVSACALDRVNLIDETEHGMRLHKFIERAEARKAAKKKAKQRVSKRQEKRVPGLSQHAGQNVPRERTREEKRGEDILVVAPLKMTNAASEEVDARSEIMTATPTALAVAKKGRSEEQKSRSLTVNRRYRERYEQREGHPPTGMDGQANGIIARFSDKHAENAIVILDWFFDCPDTGFKRSGWALQLLFDQAPKLWRELNDKRKAVENLAAPAQQRIIARNASNDLELERANEILAREMR